MEPATNPYERVLQLAAERLFVASPNLAVPLAADPSVTLFLLSHQPEKFGKLLESPTEQRRRNLENLITAAKAYVVARRKSVADAIEQLELGLPETI